MCRGERTRGMLGGRLPIRPPKPSSLGFPRIGNGRGGVRWAEGGAGSILPAEAG